MTGTDVPTAPAGLTPDATLKFWQEYLLQTRKEIDLEKTEGTKILHLKILLIGALFLLLKGALGLVAIALLPIAMLALDRMQLSRLEYILHRWEYLHDHAVPELRKALGASARFFEESVIQRQKDHYYLPVEAMIRRLLFVPAYCAATVAAGAAVAVLVRGPEGGSYVAALLWLCVLTVPAVHNPDVYGRRWVFVTAAVVVAALLIDYLVMPGFSVITVIRRTLEAPNNALKLTSAAWQVSAALAA